MRRSTRPLSRDSSLAPGHHHTPRQIPRQSPRQIPPRNRSGGIGGRSPPTDIGCLPEDREVTGQAWIPRIRQLRRLRSRRAGGGAPGITPPTNTPPTNPNTFSRQPSRHRYTASPVAGRGRAIRRSTATMASATSRPGASPRRHRRHRHPLLHRRHRHPPRRRRRSWLPPPRLRSRRPGTAAQNRRTDRIDEPRIPVASRLPTSWRDCRFSRAEVAGVVAVTTDTSAWFSGLLARNPGRSRPGGIASRLLCRRAALAR
jgi:hypothetical protein